MWMTKAEWIQRRSQRTRPWPTQAIQIIGNRRKSQILYVTSCNIYFTFFRYNNSLDSHSIVWFQYLQCLGAPHIDSFNYMLQDGLQAAIADLVPAEFEVPGGERVKITIDEAGFAKPSVPMEAVGVKNQIVLPTECRQRAATYKGDFKIRLTLKIDEKCITVDRSLGSLPIMVKVSYHLLLFYSS